MSLNRREFLIAAASLPISRSLLDSQRAQSRLYYPSKTPIDPWLEIDLDSIAWNLKAIQKIVYPRPVMAIVKANGYGHGVVEISKFLERQNIKFLAVGKFEEACRVREAGVRVNILNLGPFSDQEANRLIRDRISQSVYTDSVKVLSESSVKLGKSAGVHINIDTGLGRVGVPYYKAVRFIKYVASLQGVKIEGVFTVLTEEKNFDRIQLQRFTDVCRKAEKMGISVGLKHAASSAGILSFPESYLDMVRPGITIYGHYPSMEEYRKKRVKLKPAMSLKTRVIYLKRLRKGDSVSYHRKFQPAKETLVATLPIGYSDGYPANIAGKGEAIIRGIRHPIVAITANHTVLDVGHHKDIRIGDEAVLIGRQKGNEIRTEEVAEWAGTSVYKIVIGMNPLLPRKYTTKK